MRIYTRFHSRILNIHFLPTDVAMLDKKPGMIMDLGWITSPKMDRHDECCVTLFHYLYLKYNASRNNINVNNYVGRDKMTKLRFTP